jgi:1,4-alpha-glucan branching enzyme
VNHELNIFHRDDNNFVLAYQRSETIVIVNFGPNRFEKYELTLPTSGQFRVRFNSSWRGYSPDFAEASIDIVSTEESGQTSLALSDYSAIILSPDD